tara:strand:- start:18894 stop:19154 length:261 start_codon:yes stop_codon:yes gene_type:complete
LIDLSKEEYTLSEIAGLLLVTKSKVGNDFRRGKIRGSLKRKKFSSKNGLYTVTTRKDTWFFSRIDVIRYIKELKAAGSLGVDIFKR